ncbi:hypothetical protein GSI_04826 [Ganoderma sinense ZZ0214-1]|uniref:F-box domain-containing protein n=1 Tax=Ganoderma sinense ZZ0214-1 TaxID=1077348 RepID=A0A2G8SG31_9APHY|nr:hypothetical protein GSI_04826 [Ganoderma sinense ZZ0214-1]
MRCKGSPLMPRIRDLVVLDLLTSETSALVLQLSPSLRSLNILFSLEAEKEDRPIAPNVASSLLETIPLIAPNLEKFYCDIDVDISRGFIESFAHCARLNTLSMSAALPLDGGALRMLPSIPSLRDLTCSIDLSRKSEPLRPYTFQHLMRLQVAGPFDDLTAFISACELPSLTCITVRFQQPPSAQHPLNLLTAICQRCNPALLTSFSTHVLYQFFANTPRLMEYFEPLLALPNIKSFRLWFSHAIPSIHDDDLTRIGTSWPRLSYFSVSRLPMKLDVPPDLVRPTLSALVDLARRCPHLESFGVPELDAKVVPEENAAALPLGHALRSLSVGDVVLPWPEPITHLAGVAKVVDRVFPSIELREPRMSVNGWVRLLRLLKTMRVSREP